MEPQGHYQPLLRNTNSDSFRLLHLRPGKRGEPITCHLRLSDVPGESASHACEAYEAVSYAWGPETPRFSIRLGAWPFHIRKNLWDFLQQQRHLTEPTVLWIDAICINQSNTDERAYQVQLMDRIYRGARRVLVWLGAVEDDGENAMNLIGTVSQDYHDISHHTQSDIKALSTWSHRPYWNRTWVVQEFVLAQDVVVLCGTHVLDWLLVERFMYNIERSMRVRSPSNRHPWTAFMESPAYILMKERLIGCEKAIPLELLLVRHQHTEGLDARDKIYAMLGLAKDAHGAVSVQVSYTKPARFLLFEIIRSCEIATTNVARYVRFLANLLEINSHDMAPVSGAEFKATVPRNDKMLAVSAFTMGTVIYCASLEGALPSEHAQKRDTASLGRALGGVSAVRISKMLNQLDQYMTASCLSLKAKTSLVVVFGSRCVRQEILLGLSFGNARRGDHVHYFLGHEVGLLTDARAFQAHTDIVRGRVVCAQSEFDDTCRDSLTYQPLHGYTIQGQSDLVDATQRLSLQVGMSDALKLFR